MINEGLTFENSSTITRNNDCLTLKMTTIIRNIFTYHNAWSDIQNVHIYQKCHPTLPYFSNMELIVSFVFCGSSFDFIVTFQPRVFENYKISSNFYIHNNFVVRTFKNYKIDPDCVHVVTLHP